LVEKGTPGFDARVITGKGSVRAIWQTDITLTGVRVPADNRLPGADSFKDAGKILAGTRSSIAWMSLGHGLAAYESALAYARQRNQFGQSLVSFQLVQQKLASMLAEVTAMQLYCLQLARLQAEGRLTDVISSLAKMNNARKARWLLAEARDMLGGNGILLDYHVMRHMADIEALYTFEGTDTIQALIVGRDITGVGAFR
jgi:glutaryl-CoA dehydrogenase